MHRGVPTLNFLTRTAVAQVHPSHHGLRSTVSIVGAHRVRDGELLPRPDGADRTELCPLAGERHEGVGLA
jgi:hypothetical protein